MSLKTYKTEIIISFTEISKFFNATAEQKVKLISEIKNKMKNDSKWDYYRPMRLAINRFIRYKDKSIFDNLIESIEDPAKKNHFSILIKGYITFIKKNKGELFIPKFIMLNINDLGFSLKADFGIWTPDNKMTLVKLYYKKEPLTKSENTLSLYLLKREYQLSYGEDVECGILDIRRNKLYLSSKDSKLELILNSELELFAKMLKAA